MTAEVTFPASPAWAIRHLLQVGLLTPDDVVHGAMEAQEVSVSHATFTVRRHGQPGWFIKRADPTRAIGRGLGEEATVYRMARTRAQLARHLPAALHLADDGQTLVLEAVEGEHGVVSSEALRATGAALARVHSVLCPNFGTAPWLLTALQPRWRRYEWLPQPSATVLLRLRDSAVAREAFDRARREWRTGRLVHGDIRSANLVYVRDTDSVILLDWELACSGDPAWDVGSMLADTLTISAAQPPANDVWLTVEDRWTETVAAYRDVAQVSDHTEWTAFVERSIRLCGIRLVQSMIEHGYNGAADLDASVDLLWPWMLHCIEAAPALGPQLAERSAS